MTETFEVWVQEADLSVSTEVEVGRASEALSCYDAQNWPEKLDKKAAIEQADKFACPPGFGVVRSDGAILHGCPQKDGSLEVHWHSEIRIRFWKVFSKSLPSFYITNVRVDDFYAAVKSFFDFKDTRVAQHLKVELP